MKRPNIKNYRQAAEFLNLKKERPYANNTRIELDNKIINVKLHGNTVVSFWENGAVFSSCGWKTLTTKDRINWFLPDGFMLYQEKKTWYVRKWKNQGDQWRDDAKTWVFKDGMSIDSDGHVSGAALKP